MRSDTCPGLTPIFPADCTWFGGDGDWDDPANWSGCNGGVPGADDTAVINAGQVNLSGELTVSGLTMTDTTRTFALLVSGDPQPGVGYSQSERAAEHTLYLPLVIRP